MSKINKDSIDVNGIASDLESKEVTIGDRKFNMLEVGIYVAAIVEAIGCFLPVISSEAFGLSISAKFIEGNGKLAILLVVAICIATHMKKDKIALGIGIVNVLLVIYNCYCISSANTWGLTHLAFGGYVLIVSAIVLAGMSFLFFTSLNKK